MPTSPHPARRWTAATIERLNHRLGVQHDDDIECEDWPAAMSDPALVDAALEAYDSADIGDDGRALLVELLFNTFEFSGMELDGNPDWRRTLDRLERDYAEHAATIAEWAEPGDGNPWLISASLQALRRRRDSGDGPTDEGT